MDIKAPQVIKLRESTGLGMMTCKKALIEANGDMEMAIDNLRKQGQMTAAKRAGRVAKEGIVSIVIKDSDALIYEVNSETDFVARNKDFLSFVENLGKIIIDKKPADMEKTMALTSPLFEDQTIEAKILEIIGKIGEKISFRRFKLISTDPTKERAVSYIHGNGKIGEKISFRRFKLISTEPTKERAVSYIHGNGKIGVLVVISADKSELLDSQSIADLGKDLAMQITALKPIAVTRENMPKEIIEKADNIMRFLHGFRRYTSSRIKDIIEINDLEFEGFCKINSIEISFYYENTAGKSSFRFWKTKPRVFPITKVDEISRKLDYIHYHNF